jgi:hypothetical protein
MLGDGLALHDIKSPTQGTMSKTKMTKEDAIRIQRAETKKTGGVTRPGSFAATAQSVADKRTSKRQ